MDVQGTPTQNATTSDINNPHSNSERFSSLLDKTDRRPTDQPGNRGEKPHQSSVSGENAVAGREEDHGDNGSSGGQGNRKGNSDGNDEQNAKQGTVFQNRAKELLNSVLGDFRQQFASKGERNSNLELNKIFDGKQGAGKKLEQLSNGQHQPNIQVVDDHVLGDADAAYSSDGKGTIYLKKSLFDADADPKILSHAMAEELGHHIDAKLGGKDARGDEGALFSDFIYKFLNSQQRAVEQSQSDWGSITVNNKQVDVEFLDETDSVSHPLPTGTYPGFPPAYRVYTNIEGDTENRFRIENGNLIDTSNSTLDEPVYLKINYDLWEAGLGVTGAPEKIGGGSEYFKYDRNLSGNSLSSFNPNNIRPTFENTENAVSLTDAQVNSDNPVVGNYAATISIYDNAEMQYSLQGADKDLFEIDSVGNLKFKTYPVDATRSYQVQIVATTTVPLFGNVTQTKTNTQDVTVSFSGSIRFAEGGANLKQTSYLDSLQRNSARDNRVVVGNVGIESAPTDATITYEITGGNDGDVFKINRKTGEVSTTGAAWNSDEVTLTIKVTSRDGNVFRSISRDYTIRKTGMEIQVESSQINSDGDTDLGYLPVRQDSGFPSVNRGYSDLQGEDANLFRLESGKLYYTGDRASLRQPKHITVKYEDWQRGLGVTGRPSKVGGGKMRIQVALDSYSSVVQISAADSGPQFELDTPNALVMRKSDGVPVTSDPQKLNINIGQPLRAIDEDGDKVKYKLLSGAEEVGTLNLDPSESSGASISIDQNTGQLTYTGTVAEFDEHFPDGISKAITVRAISGHGAYQKNIDQQINIYANGIPADHVEPDQSDVVTRIGGAMALSSFPDEMSLIAFVRDSGSQQLGLPLEDSQGNKYFYTLVNTDETPEGVGVTLDGRLTYEGDLLEDGSERQLMGKLKIKQQKIIDGKIEDSAEKEFSLYNKPPAGRQRREASSELLFDGQKPGQSYYAYVPETQQPSQVGEPLVGVRKVGGGFKVDLESNVTPTYRVYVIDKDGNATLDRNFSVNSNGDLYYSGSGLSADIKQLRVEVELSGAGPTGMADLLRYGSNYKTSVIVPLYSGYDRTDAWGDKFIYGAWSQMIAAHLLSSPEFQDLRNALSTYTKDGDNSNFRNLVARFKERYSSLTSSEVKSIIDSAKNDQTSSVFEEENTVVVTPEQNAMFMQAMHQHDDLSPVDNYFSNDGPTSTNPMINAHRTGYLHAYGIPQNSPAAFLVSYTAGLRNLEFDILTTKDNVMIVTHDFSTDRLQGDFYGQSTMIQNSNYDDVKNLEYTVPNPVGELPGYERTGMTVKKFDDFVDMVKAHFPETTVYVDARNSSPVDLAKYLYDNPDVRNKYVSKLYHYTIGSSDDLVSQYAEKYTNNNLETARSQLSTFRTNLIVESANNFNSNVDDDIDLTKQQMVDTGIPYHKTSTDEAMKLDGSDIFTNDELEEVETDTLKLFKAISGYAKTTNLTSVEFAMVESLPDLLGDNLTPENRAILNTMSQDRKKYSAIVANLVYMINKVKSGEMDTVVRGLKAKMENLIIGSGDRFEDYALAERNSDGTVNNGSVRHFYFQDQTGRSESREHSPKIDQFKARRSLSASTRQLSNSRDTKYMITDLPVDLRLSLMGLTGKAGIPTDIDFHPQGVIKERYNPEDLANYSLPAWTTDLDHNNILPVTMERESKAAFSFDFKSALPIDAPNRLTYEVTGPAADDVTVSNNGIVTVDATTDPGDVSRSFNVTATGGGKTYTIQVSLSQSSSAVPAPVENVAPAPPTDQAEPPGLPAPSPIPAPPVPSRANQNRSPLESILYWLAISDAEG